MLTTRAYSTYLSKFPIKEPPYKFPSRPYGERCPSPGPSTHIIYTAQDRIPPYRFPSQSPHRGGRSISKTHLCSSLKVPGKNPYLVPQMGPPWKEMPFPRAFVHELTRNSFTGKELGPPSRAPMLGKATVQLGGRLVPQSAPFVTDSPTAIHPIGTALTP
jgi:hypothetical protein